MRIFQIFYIYSNNNITYIYIYIYTHTHTQMYNIFIYLLHNHRCITAGDIHKCVCFSNYNDQPIITKLYEPRLAFHLKSYHQAIYSPPSPLPPVTSSRAIRRRKKLWLKPYLFNSTRYLVV